MTIAAIIPLTPAPNTARVVVGIDPGITGAIALLCGDRAVRVWDMPVAADGRTNAVCPALLADILGEARDLAGERPTVIVERVAARPGQGVTSMFSFGRSLGVVEGVVGALGLPMQRVTPDAWKRRAKLRGQPKDASRAMALRLFPEVAGELARKKDAGRADALLIAMFGGMA